MCINVNTMLSKYYFHNFTMFYCRRNYSLPSMNPNPFRNPIQVRTITRHNMRAEFGAINHLINATRFNFVSIDTDYPGQILHSSPTAPRHPAAVYSLMKANVDDLKLIQVGITISDAQGNLPNFGSFYFFVWEVLISDFDPNVDAGDGNSIRVLMQQGVDFQYNLLHGISPSDFASRLEWCGLAGRQNSPVTLITCNGAYDLGYLIKLLTKAVLPENLSGFLGRVRQYFGNNVYDVKHLSSRLCNNVHGGLDSMASQLGVTRGMWPGKRTASNAWLALGVFHRIRHMRDASVVERLAGQIHNLCD